VSGARFTLEQAAWAAGAQIAAPEALRGRVHRLAQGGAARPVRRAARDNFDGSDFVAQAVQGGAAGVLVPADALAKVRAQAKGAAVLTAPDTGRALGGLAAGWRRRLPALKLVGITGSTGKTSTKELIAEVLSAVGPPSRPTATSTTRSASRSRSSGSARSTATPPSNAA